MSLAPNTEALTYSRWERLVFKLTGSWPKAVVRRRLEALEADERLMRESPKLPLPPYVGERAKRLP